MTFNEILGIVMLILFALWCFWPEKPGERNFSGRGLFPHSTNDTRNAIGGIFVMVWIAWLIWAKGAGAYLLLPFGFMGALGALAWILEWFVRRRPH